MNTYSPIEKARQILSDVRGTKLSVLERAHKAIELASLLLEEAGAIQTSSEKLRQAELAKMMHDPIGRAFTTSMTDQCFRSSRLSRIANQLTFLLKKYGVPRFVNFGKKIALHLFKNFGEIFPKLFVPITKALIRKETSQVILPGEEKTLQSHLKERAKEGVRTNLNHLGEAILGEEEAEHRLRIYMADLSKPEIEYISVKISTICSQINLIGWEETLAIVTNRLRRLYETARKQKYVRNDGTEVPKFVNLDMEEYKDLHLTVDAFCRVLGSPEFLDYSAGIVLQSYLPDSFTIQKTLTEWALKRVANGGAPIKIRIVKGANLAMEKVEASLREWPQAPFEQKKEVDANFKKMVVYGCTFKNASAVHLGIGSHNLFDIAHALLLRSENQIEKFVEIEMLEGMADHMRRAVQKISGEVLLYCPAATKEEFQNAVAYLIRRLDENTAPENFLRHLFDLKVGNSVWKEQAALFIDSCTEKDHIDNSPRRKQNRKNEAEKSLLEAPFHNEPDTDWSLPNNRAWAEKIFEKWRSKTVPPIPIVIHGESIFSPCLAIAEDPSNPGKELYGYSQASSGQIDQALNTAKKNEQQWASTSVQKRSSLLAEVAHLFRVHRSDLIGAMMADTGKTIAEADIEVSEAVDFAEYYRRVVEEAHLLTDIKWKPKGTALVAPPWNFPCSIPAGGIIAALAAGNCVLFKPAPEAVLVGWVLVQLFWQAGISKEVLQFIPCQDSPEGSQLIQDKRLSVVILTGATATARLLLELRPELDLIAETGGKNSIIITSLADRDLAIKDLIQSAFGHAGQKCSACSLAICEKEIYEDVHFRQQLRDAAVSLRIGSQWNPFTKINPLIHVPNPTLMQGLCSLEEGEEWLLEPKQDIQNPNLWSPGIKLGVTATSFTYQNELFGPVLGIMCAENLTEAVQLANGTPYGLTAGINSLDEREQAYWLKHIEAGNCYINRGITGAIVQRQPFGGCKDSSFGIGVKAGGPNYLFALMHAEQVALPLQKEQLTLKEISHWVLQHLNLQEKEIWEASIGSYQFFWNHYFSKEHDPSKVLGQDNILKYISRELLTFRVQQKDSILDIMRVICAALICHTPLEIYGEHLFLQELPKKIKSPLLTFSQQVKQSKKRIRFISNPSQKELKELLRAECHIDHAQVLANGRLELLHYIREVSISFDYHRYGYLGREKVYEL